MPLQLTHGAAVSSHSHVCEQRDLPPFARAAVAAKIPARPDRRIESVGPGRAKVCNADVVVIFPEPVYLVLRHADLEIFRQLEADSNRTLKRNSVHGSRVFELRDIIPE